MSLQQNFWVLVLGLGLPLGLAAEVSAGQRVGAFLQALFVQHEVTAFAQAFTPDFREHDLELEPGFAAYQELAPLTGDHWRSLRVISDGDWAAVHSRLDENGQAKVRVDIFRLRGAQFAEHWSVVQRQPTKKTPNGHTMEDGATGTGQVSGQEAANKVLVKRFFEEFFAKGQSDLADSLMAPDYIQHNPGIPNGREVLRKFISANRISVTIHQLLAQGDLVLALNEYGSSITVDLFRVADNRLQEHWDVGQGLPTDLPEGRSVF